MSVFPLPEEIEKACTNMPLFPLPRVVFFPGAILRLHVFEPRYVQLLADSLEGNHMFAIPMLDMQDLDVLKPKIFPVAGFGKVIHCEEASENRYNIVMLGVGRIRIEQEQIVDRLYRVATSTLLSEEDDNFDIRPIKQLFTQIIIGNPSLSSSLTPLLEESYSPRQFLYTLAQLLLPSAEEKQQFLSTESICMQEELLTEKLAEALL